MADFDSDRIAATPGLVGQSSFASTLGATALAGTAGPALTCALGSLALVAVALSPYAIEPGMGAGQGNLCCADDLSALDMFFLRAILTLFEYWHLIMVWGAMAGAISSALVLDAAFTCFRRAAWKPVLHCYFAVNLVSSVAVLEIGLFASAGVYDDGTFAAYAIVAYLLVCGAIGVWPVWNQFGGFVKNARYLAPPRRPARQSGRRDDAHGTAGKTRAAAKEINSAIKPTYKSATLFNGAACGLFLAAPVLGHSFFGTNLFSLSVLVLWPATQFALITASLLHDVSTKGVQMIIDRRGIIAEGDTLAWTEIGRVWTVNDPKQNAVILELSPAAYRRASKSWHWASRLLHFGYTRLKEKHIGVFTTVFDAGLLDAAAQEIQEAIESRRPPRTRWMPPRTGVS